MLKIENLKASYGGGDIIRNLNISMDRGEVLCLMGRNGAGKTTTLRAIMGLMPSRTGTITLQGRDISMLKAHEIPKTGIGYVPQGRRLFAEMTVRQNLEIGRIPRNTSDAVFDQTLNLFPALKDRMDQISGTLSGGEQQMLTMARALCIQPSLLLLDEPTEGLMPSMIAVIRNVVSILSDSGVAVLLVEQRIEAVQSVAHRVAFLENGVLKEIVDVKQVHEDPKLIRKYAGVG